MNASILIPVWNEAATIRECLADVRAQHGDWECVLVLDGPEDGTDRIVRDEVAGDGRFVVVERPHSGLVAALNAGLAVCRAEVIVRMDADDRMRPERVVRQLAALRDGVDVVTCECDYGTIGEGSRQDGMRRHVEWLNTLRSNDLLARARFIDAPVAHPAVAYRTAMVRAVGGYRDGDFAEDHDLWLRLFARGVVFGFTPSDGPLVTWRDRAERATRVDGRYGDEARRALIHGHLIDVLAGRRVRLWGAGKYGRWHGRYLREAGVVISAVIDIDPKKVGRRLFGEVAVVGPEALGGPDDEVTLVVVASRGARALIAAQLEARGHREGVHWWALQ